MNDDKTASRIAEEWRREEPYGSVYRSDHLTKGTTVKRWYAQFRAKDHTGKQKTYRDTRSATKAQAQRALVELKRRAKAAKIPPVPQSTMPETVGAHLTLWHHTRVEEGIIRPTTAPNEARYIKGWTELVGPKRVRDLTPADVEAALFRLQTVTLKGKRRAIQQAYRCLRKALGDFRPRLSANPCDAIDPPTVPKPKTRAFTPDELRAVLQAVDQPRKGDSVVDETFAALVFFLANTGVRIGEALALTWGDLDLDGGAVHVRKTLTRVKGERPKRTAPKTPAAVRTIPLNTASIKRLRSLRGTFGAIPHNTAPVFISERGGTLHASNLSRRSWHPLLDELSIPRCGFHRLRHSFASATLQAGIDIVTVARILGHSNPSITLSIYGHFLPGREREATDAIAAIIGEGA
jgi:integrase